MRARDKDLDACDFMSVLFRKSCEGEQSGMEKRKETREDTVQVRHSLGLTHRERDRGHELHHKISPLFFF